MLSTWKEPSLPGDGVSIPAPKTRKISNEFTKESTVDRPGKIARHLTPDKPAFTNTGEFGKQASQAKKASRFLLRIRRSSRRMARNYWHLQSDNYFERSSWKLAEKNKTNKNKKIIDIVRERSFMERCQSDGRFSIIYHRWNVRNMYIY